LAAILNALGADGQYLTIEDVFADMTRKLPVLAGLNLSKIGDLGIELEPRMKTNRTNEGPMSADARSVVAEKP
jgi:hypothetical protein